MSTLLNLTEQTPAFMLLEDDSHLWLSDNDFEDNQNDNKDSDCSKDDSDSEWGWNNNFIMFIRLFLNSTAY